MKNVSGCNIGVDKRYNQKGSSTAAKTSYTAYPPYTTKIAYVAYTAQLAMFTRHALPCQHWGGAGGRRHG